MHEHRLSLNPSLAKDLVRIFKTLNFVAAKLNWFTTFLQFSFFQMCNLHIVCILSFVKMYRLDQFDRLDQFYR